MTKLQSENEQKLNRIEAGVTECEREFALLKVELSAQQQITIRALEVFNKTTGFGFPP